MAPPLRRLSTFQEEKRLSLKSQFLAPPGSVERGGFARRDSGTRSPTKPRKSVTALAQAFDRGESFKAAAAVLEEGPQPSGSPGSARSPAERPEPSREASGSVSYRASPISSPTEVSSKALPRVPAGHKAVAPSPSAGAKKAFEIIQRKNEKLEKQLSKSAEKIKELEKKLVERAEERASTSEEEGEDPRIAELEEKLRDANAERRVREAEHAEKVKALEAEIQTKNSRIQDLLAKARASDGRVKELSGSVTEKVARIEDMSSRCVDLERTISNLKKDAKVADDFAEEARTVKKELKELRRKSMLTPQKVVEDMTDYDPSLFNTAALDDLITGIVPDVSARTEVLGALDLFVEGCKQRELDSFTLTKQLREQVTKTTKAKNAALTQRDELEFKFKVAEDSSQYLKKMHEDIVAGLEQEIGELEAELDASVAGVQQSSQSKVLQKAFFSWKAGARMAWVHRLGRDKLEASVLKLLAMNAGYRHRYAEMVKAAARGLEGEGEEGAGA